jgi:ParB-like chromosome segregation protein Spo0J
MAKLKNHPYADLFPMMTDEELEALAEDIKENGLCYPVVRYQGMVLDGRNRLLACEKAGVEPTFAEHEGDDASALALVISLNVQRRDMTAGQRAPARHTPSKGYTKRR